MNPPLLILVRGIGDVGSAVAQVLFRRGNRVAIHDGPAPPTAHRREMAFTDAVFDGVARLDGVPACRVDVLDGIAEMVGSHLFVPVITGQFANALASAPWFILVDARMRKRAVPKDQRHMAPLTIGLGPGFIAGETVDLAIETAWGDRLGAIIEVGAPAALAGEPRPINGTGRERLVYAPNDGIWHTRRRIGEAIEAGQLVGWAGETPVTAPLSGTIRGLTHNGVPCARRTKIVEVDPRGVDQAIFRGLGERPRKIAEGVATAIGQYVATRFSSQASAFGG